MTDDLRAKIAELRRLGDERRTYPHVGIAGVMRLDQALQIGDFLANEAERLAAENELLRTALRPFATYGRAVEAAYHDYYPILLDNASESDPCEPVPPPTIGDCRQAAKLLEGKP